MFPRAANKRRCREMYRVSKHLYNITIRRSIHLHICRRGRLLCSAISRYWGPASNSRLWAKL